MGDVRKLDIEYLRTNRSMGLFTLSRKLGCTPELILYYADKYDIPLPKNNYDRRDRILSKDKIHKISEYTTSISLRKLAEEINATPSKIKRIAEDFGIDLQIKPRGNKRVISVEELEKVKEMYRNGMTYTSIREYLKCGSIVMNYLKCHYGITFISRDGLEENVIQDNDKIAMLDRIKSGETINSVARSFRKRYEAIYLLCKENGVKPNIEAISAPEHKLFMAIEIDTPARELALVMGFSLSSIITTRKRMKGEIDKSSDVVHERWFRPNPVLLDKYRKQIYNILVDTDKPISMRPSTVKDLHYIKALFIEEFITLNEILDSDNVLCSLEIGKGKYFRLKT